MGDLKVGKSLSPRSFSGIAAKIQTKTAKLSSFKVRPALVRTGALLVAFVGVLTIIAPASAEPPVIEGFDEYGPVPGGFLEVITPGPDGNMWFADFTNNNIGYTTLDGVITEFPVPTPDSQPVGITAGPDGNLWFTETNAQTIGRITPAGVITEFPIPSGGQPWEITAGPDGNLWFTQEEGIGRITPDGSTIDHFPALTPASEPTSITTGPDGNLWFSQFEGESVARITPTGTITEFPTSGNPWGITAGPDGNVWFTLYEIGTSPGQTSAVARITPGGTITEFPLPSVGGPSRPVGITTGPDGNLWFVESTNNLLSAISPDGSELTQFELPDGGHPSPDPWIVATGPDDRLWLTQKTAAQIVAVSLDLDLPTDFSDNPDTYGTSLANDGVHHTVLDLDEGNNTAPLMLGGIVDVEEDGFPGPGADGDDLNNLDDEDGVPDPILLVPGEQTQVDVTVVNNTDDVATLAGWIDLNENGMFDVGERQLQQIPANSGSNPYTLTFPAAFVADDTYARFRIFPGDLADPSPTGGASNGEVEDYLVQTASVRYQKTVDPPVTEIQPGETFTFTVTVENTGTTALTGLSFTDDLSDVVDDATYNGDVSADIGTANFVPGPPEQVEWSGDLGVGQTATITYSFDTNDPPTGDGIMLNGVVGTGPGSNCTDDPATDPDCLVRTPLPQLSSQKVLVSPANPQADDTVNYQFIITNDGPGAATSIAVADDLTGVLDDAVYNNDASAGSGTVTYNPTTQRLNWNGDLAANGDPGDSVTVSFSVDVNSSESLGDGILENGLITADCPNPPIFDDTDPNYDPDCVTVTPIVAWQATKTAEPTGGIVMPGDDITYTVEVENLGGGDLTGISFTDDLTNAIDDASYNNDESATTGNVSFTSPNITWTGDIPADDSATITYSVTVNDADALGDGVLNNAVTGTPNCPTPAITDPDDPNFNPDCVIIHDTAAWTLSKTSDAVGPVQAGDDVNYTTTVENTGSVQLSIGLAARFDDDLSDVLDDATYNNDAAATFGEVSYNEPFISWFSGLGGLPVGGSSTITYSVTVNEASADGDGQLVNALTGGPCPSPAITDPDDPDFNPDCVTITQVSEWIATKTNDSGGAVNPGDTINYSILVENTGTVDLTSLSVPDDLTDVLSNATYNGDESATSGVVGYTEPTLTWDGDLTAGDSATITYSVQVHDEADLTDGRMANAITGSPNCPSPAISDPDDPDYNPDCATITYVAAFTVVKTSDPANGTDVRPGDTITYTITIENTGILAFTEFDLTDNLSDVLDDAVLVSGPVVNPGSSGTATLAGNNITFDGNIPTGQTATVTYSVALKDADQLGNSQLNNTVNGPFSNCATGEEDDCNTSHNVLGSSFLPNTGQSIGIFGAVGVLLIAGSATVMHRRRPTFSIRSL